MFVRVLGSAAGGGFPQWNCFCRNCGAVRRGDFPGTARSQTQLAVSADGAVWFLVNASPDLRAQIEGFPALHPRVEAHRDSPIRHSPIEGVLLTSAELDAALGLLLLRESQPLNIFATASVRKLLVEDNSFFGVLRRQTDQARWHEIRPGQSFEVLTLQGKPSGICCTPISTGGAFPGHVPAERAMGLNQADAVVGMFLEHNGRQLAFFPCAATVEPAWLPRMAECDAVFFDGTFWSDDELRRVQGSAKTARQMGHQPVGSAGGTLEQLSALTGPRRILIHINNTNPLLDEASPEHRRVREAGWEVASDGMEMEL